MEKEARMSVAERCDPKFVEALLNLFEEPPSIEVAFRSEEAEKGIKKVAAFSGIREPVITEIRLYGKVVSKEKALEFYKQTYNDEVFSEEPPSNFRIREPLITLKKMKWEKLNEYKVEFDGYSIQAEFTSKNELVDKIFELANKFQYPFFYKSYKKIPIERKV